MATTTSLPATSYVSPWIDPTLMPGTNCSSRMMSCVWIASIGSTIATKQAAVDQLQTNLTNQMATADAAIASMQQQYSYMSQMFAAQQTADLMYANE